jgi:hypothetical protein
MGTGGKIPARAKPTPMGKGQQTCVGFFLSSHPFTLSRVSHFTMIRFFSLSHPFTLSRASHFTMICHMAHAPAAPLPTVTCCHLPLQGPQLPSLPGPFLQTLFLWFMPCHSHSPCARLPLPLKFLKLAHLAVTDSSVLTPTVCPDLVRLVLTIARSISANSSMSPCMNATCSAAL